MFQATAQGIGKKLLGKALDELVPALHQNLLQAARATEGCAAGQRSGGIDIPSAFTGSILADGVVVFQSKSERIQKRMTGGASSIGAMFLERRAHILG